MDKFLIELVRLNGSAILPEFGALSIADESTGELMFNEYLKFNDGKLTQLVIENSSMDDQEAQNSIAKYVRDIRIQLDKGESYDIFGIGSFRKDNDGAIIFEGSLSGKDKKEEVILGPSPTPTAVSEPVIIETDNVQDTSEESAEESTNTQQEKPEVIAVTTDTPPPPTEEPVQAKQEKSKKKEATKKKKGGLFYILLFLLLAIAGGGTYVGLNYDEVKSYFGWDKFDEIESIAGLVDSDIADNDGANNDLIEDDSSPAEDDVWEDEQMEGDFEEFVEETAPVEQTPTPAPAPAPQPSPQPTQSVNTSGTPFHLIGGSFSERGNAENFVNDMQAKGYPSHIVGEFNGMHMVSVKSFSTREDAMREISTIQDDAPKAWLFKHPK